MQHFTCDMIRILCAGVPYKRRARSRLVTQERKRKGHPATWAASSSRENSSNGRSKSRQNFLAKSYESKNRGVKQFLGNKCLCFQSVSESINSAPKCSILRQNDWF